MSVMQSKQEKSWKGGVSDGSSDCSTVHLCSDNHPLSTVNNIIKDFQ